jgi:hypothetical protein
VSLGVKVSSCRPPSGLGLIAKPHNSPNRARRPIAPAATNFEHSAACSHAGPGGCFRLDTEAASPPLPADRLMVAAHRTPSATSVLDDRKPHACDPELGAEARERVGDEGSVSLVSPAALRGKSSQLGTAGRMTRASREEACQGLTTAWPKCVSPSVAELAYVAAGPTRLLQPQTVS